MIHADPDAERQVRRRTFQQDDRSATDQAVVNPADSVALRHRTMGNQAMQAANSRDDEAGRDVLDPSTEAEREAERVADAVVQDSGDSIVRPSQRPRRPNTPDATPVGASPIEEALEGLGGGRDLRKSEHASIRRQVEGQAPDVSVHTGPHADRIARSVDAAALTYGSDIVFRSGTYEPGTIEGRRLLAHELGHAAQQDPSSPVVQRQSNGSNDMSEEEQRNALRPQVLLTQSDLGDLRPHPFADTSALDEQVRQHINTMIERAITRGIQQEVTDPGAIIEEAWEIAHAEREAADHEEPGYARHLVADHYLHSRFQVANTWRPRYLWDITVEGYDALKIGLEAVGQLDILATGSQPVSEASYWVSSWAQLGSQHGSEDYWQGD